jgi:hypothetical protein
MPKFTDKDIKDYGLLKSEESKPCIECEDLSNYIEICTEGRFCSSECCDKFYKEYDEWIRSLEGEEI